jgi:hypothetical protein
MAASTGPAPVTAPDAYGTRPGAAGYLACHGARSIYLQVSNSGIVYQLGHGSPPLFDSPEIPLLPVVAAKPTPCDAIRYRAQTPLAQLATGQQQARVQIDTAP